MIFKPSGARKTISDLSVQKWANPGTQGLITRGGFGMRFFEDPQSPIPIPIFHFGLDQKIFENPQKKILKKSPILSRGLGIFEILGIFISEIRQIQGIGVFWEWGFFGDGEFFSWDAISHQNATSGWSPRFGDVRIFMWEIIQYIKNKKTEAEKKSFKF